MFIDTHSHLYLGELSHHIPEAIEHLTDAGFSHAIQIGTNIETSEKCIELAREYDMIRATIGIHPCEAQDLPIEKIPEQIEALEKMIQKYAPLLKVGRGDLSRQESISPAKQENGKSKTTLNCIVGIGEIGFDHYHLSRNTEEAELQKSRQIQWFHAQIALALKYDLPVVIHTRNCPSETLTELKKSGLKKFVIHCFSESWDFAGQIFALGPDTKISFTGILTYPKSVSIQEVAQKAPLHSIMIETDAPYLIPEAKKGIAPYCEPAFSRYVFDEICKLRSESPDVIEQTLWQNSVKFFGL